MSVPPIFPPRFILPKSTSFFSFAHKKDFYRYNIRKIRWKRGNPLGIDVRCEKSKVEAEDIFFSDRFAIFAKKSRNVAFFTIFEDVLGIFPTSFLTFLSTTSPRWCWLIQGGGQFYYCLLLYCSSAGKGLTRDSALSGLPASNNLVPTNRNVVGARPSVDFATHGFAEVAAVGGIIQHQLAMVENNATDMMKDRQ